MRKQRSTPPDSPPHFPIITKTTLAWLGVIILFGLALRILYLRQISGDIFTQSLIIDAKFYDEWALGLLRGTWNGAEAFYQDPLYAYFLAICYAVFGHAPNAVRFAQAALDAGTLGLLFALGGMLFNARVGLLSALVGALYGPMIYYCGLLDKTTFTLFLTALSLASVVYAAKQSKPLGLFLSGLVFGMTALARGNILFAALATTLWLVWRKQSFLRCAAFAVGFIAVIGLVFARNYRASGDLVPLTANAGLNFFIGNNPNTVGTYLEPPFLHGIPEDEFMDSKRAAERFLGKKLTKASEVSAFWLRQGFAFIFYRPVAWLNLLWKKIFLTFHRFEIPETYSFYYFKERAPVLSAAFLGYGLIAPLGVLGAAVCFIRGNLNLLHVFLITYAFSLWAFFITSRYRFPLLVPMIVFGAMLLAEAGERFKSRTWNGIGAVSISLLFLLALCQWTPDWMKHFVVDPSLATPHTIAGYLHLQPPGNIQSAINELETARAINPGEPNIHAQLGTAYERTGRLDEAISALEEAVRRNRLFHEAHNNLAMLYFRRGNAPMALAAIRSALELRPDDPTYQRSYRMVTAGQRAKRVQ
jgi:4-amino-4-deoxy-L-arabinose transferase-like glycosyltransferase